MNRQSIKKTAKKYAPVFAAGVVAGIWIVTKKNEVTSPSPRLMNIHFDITDEDLKILNDLAIGSSRSRGIGPAPEGAVINKIVFDRI